MSWRLLVLSLCASCGAVDPISLGKLPTAPPVDARVLEDAGTADTSAGSEEEDDQEQEGENE